MSNWYRAVKVGKILAADWQAGDTELFNISVNYNVTNTLNGETVSKSYTLDGELVCDEILENCSEWYLVWSKYHNTEARDQLHHAWRNFKSTWVADNLPYILAAMLAEYNPVDNYGGWEVENTTGETSGNSSATSTGSATGSMSYDGTSDTKHYETTYDDYTTTDRMKWNDVNTLPGTSTSNDTETEAYTNTTGTSDIDRKLYRHGNMGTTMTQTMIEAELNTRKKDVVTYIIETFRNNYLCLLADEESDEI